MRILVIDDLKDPKGASVIARTYSDGIMALFKMGPFDELWLDHDLGAVKREYDDRGNELTGYDVLCWLERNPQYLPGKIHVISLNGGRVPIMLTTIEALYRKNS